MSELTEMTDTAQEAATEALEAQEAGEKGTPWHRQVAFTTLIMALLAALAGLLGGITADAALIDRTREIIEVSYLEGNRACAETLKAKHEILTVLGKSPDAAEVERLRAFEKEQEVLQAESALEEVQVFETSSAHMTFAIAVTLLSLGITLGGMAVVVERRALWVAGLVFGAAGAAAVGLGVLRMLS